MRWKIIKEAEKGTQGTGIKIKVAKIKGSRNR